jgi:hypothetical protein
MFTATTERTLTETPTRAILGFLAKLATALVILIAAFLILFVISTAWMPDSDHAVQIFLN